MTAEAERLRGAVPLPDGSAGGLRAWRAALGVPPAPPPPRSPFAPPIEDEPADVAPPTPRAVTRPGVAEKSDERLAQGRKVAGALARERAAAARKAAAADPPPGPRTRARRDGSEPPPPPSGPQPCEVCAVPVAPDYIARTGRARHGHHPA